MFNMSMPLHKSAFASSRHFEGPPVTTSVHLPAASSRCSIPNTEPPCATGVVPRQRIWQQHQQQRRMRPHRATADTPAAEPAQPVNEPWTEDDLTRMAAEYEDLQESAVGNAWRSMFENDIQDLYSYTDREEAEWASVLDRLKALPKNEWERSSLVDRAQSFSPPLVSSFIGMGTWRLRNALDPVITFLANRIEGTWREAFENDLNLYPASAWKNQYDICDSIDPKRELDGWSYADVPFPEEGQEGYPRMLIENRLYCSRVFRKLHLELAFQQNGLQVLHMVMYPRYKVDIPILAADIVVVNGRVTLAIIDACPVRKNKQLPHHYLKTMHDLQQEFLTDASSQRTLPDWGTAIFSPACVCIRPQSPEELAGFMRYAVALTRAHCALATLVQPLSEEDPRHRQRIAELLQGHKSFVDNQLANKKTSRVLEAAFGQEWTDQYMRDIMFDFKPDAEPAWEDASLNQLFRYFEENPELGDRAEEMMQLQAQVELQRAEEVLSDLDDGVPVRMDRVEEALRMLYMYDEEFKRNCHLLLPGLAVQKSADVGKYLASHIRDLGLPEPMPRWTGGAK